MLGIRRQASVVLRFMALRRSPGRPFGKAEKAERRALAALGRCGPFFYDCVSVWFECFGEAFGLVYICQCENVPSSAFRHLAKSMKSGKSGKGQPCFSAIDGSGRTGRRRARLVESQCSAGSEADSFELVFS